MTFRDDTMSRELSAQAQAAMLRHRCEELEKKIEEQADELNELRAKRSWWTQLQDWRKARKKTWAERDRFTERFSSTWWERHGAGALVAFVTLGGLAFGLLFWHPQPSMTGGVITNLRHHHAYTTHSTHCSGSGSRRHCHPVTHFHPEKWVAIVCDEGECERIHISEQRFNVLHDGMFMCLREPCQRHEDHEEVYNQD